MTHVADRALVGRVLGRQRLVVTVRLDRTEDRCTPELSRFASHPPPAPTGVAAAIARLRKDLDDLAHQSTDTFVGLVERIVDIEPGAESAASSSTAWCWRNLGPRAGEELWDQPTDWVDWIRSRYPLARKVPACWDDHPEILEELTAPPWLACQAAYQDRNASLTAAAEWHDHLLPGLVYRLEHGPFALDCANGHRPRPATAYAARADTQEEVSCSTWRR